MEPIGFAANGPKRRATITSLMADSFGTCRRIDFIAAFVEQYYHGLARSQGGQNASTPASVVDLVERALGAVGERLQEVCQLRVHAPP